jgi:hypothetical protein
MEYTKHLKGVSGVNAAKLALWAALLFMAVIAGIAALGPGPY